jgi:fatty acid desaturase
MLASEQVALAAPEPAPRVARQRAVSQEFTHSVGLSLAELHALVADLSLPRASIYWTDLLATCAVGYGSLWLSLTASAGPWTSALWLVFATCAVYRMTLFTHELAHVPGRQLRAFRVVWNLICGIPFLVPSFLYEMHGAHHDRRSFASLEDGEYRAFTLAPRREALASVAGSLLALPLLVTRFLVLAPLSWLFPPLRRFVLTKLSALVIDERYVRPLPVRRPVRWLLQELACFAWCLLWLALAASHQVSIDLLLRGGLVLTGAVLMNSLRVLCAHRYRSTGESRSFLEQVLDSNNFPNGIAWLWAPLGLRFHAVHHLFPTLPYHALGEAYRRIMRSLPVHSEFRQTYRQSFLSGLDEVVGRRANGPSV